MSPISEEQWKGVNEPRLEIVGAEGFVGRVFKLQVVPCGAATKVLNKVAVKVPAVAPVWGRGEDNVGVDGVVSFPNPPKNSTVRLATCRSDETSSLMSEGVRLLAVVEETRK